MISGVRHAGLVVENMETSLTFFASLGFVVKSREIESGDFVSTVVGLSDVSIDIAKLVAPDGTMIELLQYLSHPDLITMVKQPSNKLGCSHIALSTRSVNELVEKIISLGGSAINPPVKSPSGGTRVAYCHSPEGILIEVVEQLNQQ